MNAPPATLVALLERLVNDVANQSPQTGAGGPGIPVEHYFSEERLAQERRSLFRHYPLIVGHSSQLDQPGTVLRHDALGLPVLITRDAAGKVHALLNVCRHRGMRLVEEQGACPRKTIVCPYHGWTYELDGKLRHAPHAETFPGLQPADTHLASLPCEVRDGLIWVLPTPGATLDLDTYLGPINQELAYFGLDDATLYNCVDVVRHANWKLVIDAFLEAYHIRVLHRDTIYPFFLDAMAVSDSVGPHLRSAAARRRITEAANIPREQWDLREHCTYTHFIFPNTVLIFHPDYTSQISVFPVDGDHLRWVHHMLVPRREHTPERQPHWEKTLNLIENTVFQREDLYAAEGIQAGLRSGANQVLRTGRLEYTLRIFHDNIQKAIENVGGEKSRLGESV